MTCSSSTVASSLMCSTKCSENDCQWVLQQISGHKLHFEECLMIDSLLIAACYNASLKCRGIKIGHGQKFLNVNLIAIVDGCGRLRSVGKNLVDIYVSFVLGPQRKHFNPSLAHTRMSLIIIDCFPN